MRRRDLRRAGVELRERRLDGVILQPLADAERVVRQAGVPTKNSVQIEIVAFTEPQPVTFPGHSPSTFGVASFLPAASQCFIQLNQSH
jgi:hypothetical protein